MNNITIGFSTSNRILSKIIRFITRSKVSHAWIAFDDTTLNMRMVLQAEAWGFEVRPWERWCHENTLVGEFIPVGNDLTQAFVFISKYLGTKYDYDSAAIVGFFDLLKKWFKVKFTISPNENPSKLMCSEAVIRFLQYADYVVVRYLNPETTSPGGLYERILMSAEFTQKEDVKCG